MKLKQMIAAGVKVGGLDGDEKKKKAVYDNKKKKGGRKNPEEAKVCSCNCYWNKESNIY
jgi:translation initiation factor 5B